MITRILSHALAICIVALLSSPAWSQTVYFDDSDVDTIKIGNDHYEISLLKASGSIVGIVDKSTGGLVSRGTAEGSLWSAEFPAFGIPSAQYASSSEDTVRYAWDTADR